MVLYSIVNSLLPIKLIDGSIPLGLPATSIALDEQRIYWTNSTSTTIYYVERSDVDTLLTLESSVAGAIVITTSPGTQQLPPYTIGESTFVCDPFDIGYHFKVVCSFIIVYVEGNLFFSIQVEIQIYTWFL